MRSTLLISILFLTILSMAQDLTSDKTAQIPCRKKFEQLRTKHDMAEIKKKADVYQVVTHLAVNDQWKSTSFFRNDLEKQIVLYLEFYDPDGYPVSVDFYDSDGEYWNGTGFQLPLSQYEIFSIDFDYLENGWQNFQIFCFSTEADQYYSIETIFNRYDGSTKIASVGVPTQQPYYYFYLNVDQAIDAYSGFQKRRGIAVTNTQNTTCTCDIYLFDDGKNGDNYFKGAVDSVSLELPPYSKWVSMMDGLFPDVDNDLRMGFGYLYVECDYPVVALGLGFEDYSPIAASVPVSPIYTAAKRNKMKTPDRVIRKTPKK